MNDLFLKIIAGEIPCDKVYEDEETFAFLDINPTTKGHTLVVPKKYSRNLFTLNEGEFGRLMQTAHKVAHALQKVTGAEGINIIMNNEAAAGQIVFHAHVHVIPRWMEDNAFPKPNHTTYAEGEKDTLVEKIKTALL